MHLDVVSTAELFVGRWRTDRRCGSEFPLPGDGAPAECDPASANPCCSKWGFCGPGADHCKCPTCKDYRTSQIREGERCDSDI